MKTRIIAQSRRVRKTTGAPDSDGSPPLLRSSAQLVLALFANPAPRLSAPHRASLRPLRPQVHERPDQDKDNDDADDEDDDEGRRSGAVARLAPT
jgi:hypothetical protein